MELKHSGIIPLAVRYLVKSKTTLYYVHGRQYVHFKYDDLGILNLSLISLFMDQFQ